MRPAFRSLLLALAAALSALADAVDLPHGRPAGNTERLDLPGAFFCPHATEASFMRITQGAGDKKRDLYVFTSPEGRVAVEPFGLHTEMHKHSATELSGETRYLGGTTSALRIKILGSTVLVERDNKTRQLTYNAASVRVCIPCLVRECSQLRGSLNTWNPPCPRAEPLFPLRKHPAED